MVNYILSFCKITGASRIFSRNFYLPLLKPQTPKDALRTFRITGKWLLGGKVQHYIPVLLNHKKKRSKRQKNYGKKRYDPTDEYTYMTPILDPDNIESHKLLTEILNKKKGKGAFVYKVEDKKYNIVIQSALELAIRDGDVIDVLVSQRNDKIIVKLNNFKKIPIEIDYFDNNNNENLYYGEGATSPEEEEFHHHGKYTMSLAKIFEDKELCEEKWEEELKRIMRKRRRQVAEGSKEWKIMIKETIRNLGKRFEVEAKKVIEEIEEPAEEGHIDMEIDNLDATKNVNETILDSGPEMLNQLPTMREIPDIIRNMGSATLTEIGVADEPEQKPRGSVSGVKVRLSSGKECFVSGQMVHTEDGDVFVPGQTVENEFGVEYAPGITINVDNKPMLISGLIMGEEEQEPLFLPTHSAITADGQLTFATTAEERPKTYPDKGGATAEESSVAVANSHLENDIVEEKKNEEVEEGNSTASSIELNNSEMEELDIEAMRLKHEQQRLELERLKQILMDDGIDDIISNLEYKKAKLQQKLEELRKLNVTKGSGLVSYIDDSDTLEIGARIASGDGQTINRLSDILMTITRRAATFRDRNSIHVANINHPSYISVSGMSETDVKFSNCSSKLKILLKAAIAAANDVFKSRPKDQLLALNSVADIMVDVLRNDAKCLESLLELMNTPYERNEVCNTIFKQLTQNIAETKISKVTCLATNGGLSSEDALAAIGRVLGKENDVKCDAFGKLAKARPELIALLVEELRKKLGKLESEEDAFCAMETSITTAVEMMMERSLEELLKGDDLQAFTHRSMAFASALGLEDIVECLGDRGRDLPGCRKPARDFLKRMTLIALLAQKDYSMRTAMERIERDPERARADPRIRQLVRESAVLLSRKAPLRSSRDIPSHLLRTQNLLAIEDFLIQRLKVELPILVSRGALQAVVPKESARSVLAGRIAYVLVDETGVTSFKPMHMLQAIGVTAGRERRFESYLRDGAAGDTKTPNVRISKRRSGTQVA